LILIGGMIASGKDTLGQLIHSYLTSKGIPSKIYKLSSKPKSMVASMIGISMEAMEDRAIKDTLIPTYKDSPRGLVKKVADWGKSEFGKMVWVKALIDEIASDYETEPNLIAIVTDVRYKYEWKVLGKHDNLRYYIARHFSQRFPGVEGLGDSGTSYNVPPKLESINPELYSLLTHESELYVSPGCTIVFNDSTIEDLNNSFNYERIRTFSLI
jgi:hypothetical protein